MNYKLIAILAVIIISIVFAVYVIVNQTEEFDVSSHIVSNYIRSAEGLEKRLTNNALSSSQRLRFEKAVMLLKNNGIDTTPIFLECKLEPHNVYGFHLYLYFLDEACNVKFVAYIEPSGAISEPVIIGKVPGTLVNGVLLRPTGTYYFRHPLKCGDNISSPSFIREQADEPEYLALPEDLYKQITARIGEIVLLDASQKIIDRLPIE